MGDNFGIHRPGEVRQIKGSTNLGEDSNTTQGQALSDFLLQLEDYTPTVSFYLWF